MRGRPFQKGQVANPRGRPKGAKDKLPRTFRALAAEILAEAPDDVKSSLLAGVKGNQAHKYLAIFANLEKQQVEVTGADGGPVQVQFVDVA